MANPPVDRHPTPETIEWDEPAPRTSSKGSIIVAVLACLVAIGVGYAGWQQWEARQAALETLSKTSAQLKVLSQDHALSQQSVSELQKREAAQKEQIGQQTTELSDLKTKLGAADARLNELQAQSDEMNAHLTEFRALTKQFQRMIDSGKLEISFRRGRMIVELPAAVLFASGSAQLSPEGKQSLQDIAKILRQVPGKRFMVGGHTDDVPIGKSGSEFTSNWSLSSARAVTVTESLIDAGLRANHLVAAGYGEYDPIASNGNERGRQKNRRIEIVLEPELGGVSNALAGLKKDAKAEKASKPTAAKH